jgi:hypothetical protein
MTDEQKPKRSPVVEELNELANKLGDALRTLLASPQRHELEEDVREGFTTVVSEISEALEKARSTDTAKDLEEQAGKVVEKVRTSKATQDLREGLVKGLQTLNDELGGLVERMKTEEAADVVVKAEVVDDAADPDPEA